MASTSPIRHVYSPPIQPHCVEPVRAPRQENQMSFIWTAQRSWSTGHTQVFPSPGGRKRWDFSSAHSVEQEKRLRHLSAEATISIISQVIRLSKLQDWQDRCWSSGDSPQKFVHWTCEPNPSFPQEKLGTKLSLSDLMMLYQEQGRW